MAITEKLIETTIDLRQKNGLKLPDAVIIASAIANNAFLLTADKQLLSSCVNYCLPVPE